MSKPDFWVSDCDQLLCNGQLSKNLSLHEECATFCLCTTDRFCDFYQCVLILFDKYTRTRNNFSLLIENLKVDIIISCKILLAL